MSTTTHLNGRCVRIGEAAYLELMRCMRVEAAPHNLDVVHGPDRLSAYRRRADAACECGIPATRTQETPSGVAMLCDHHERLDGTADPCRFGKEA